MNRLVPMYQFTDFLSDLNDILFVNSKFPTPLRYKTEMNQKEKSNNSWSE